MIIKLLLLGIIGYFIWALIYHKRDKSLTLSIMVEYLLMAALVIVAVLAASLS